MLQSGDRVKINGLSFVFEDKYTTKEMNAFIVGNCDKIFTAKQYASGGILWQLEEDPNGFFFRESNLIKQDVPCLD